MLDTMRNTTTRTTTARTTTARKATARGMTRRALAVAAAGAVLAVGVSACSPDEAGSAAIVGKRRISTEQVSTAVAEIKAATSEDVESARVLFLLVIAPQVIPVAQANGFGVSQAQARAVLPKVKDPAPATIEAVQTALTLQKMSDEKSKAAEQIRQRVIASHPEVNPRYGTFDAKKMTLQQDQPNWMVQQPKPETAPSAPAGS